MIKFIKLNKADIKKLLKPTNLLPFNRDIRKNHVNKMAKSIEKCGMLRTPIIGDISSFNNNQKYAIVDGQHLLQALININFNLREGINCIVKTYNNKLEVVKDISTINTTQKSWNDEDFLKTWYVYGNNNIEHWGFYSDLYRFNYDVFPKLSLGSLIEIYCSDKNAFRNGQGLFFDKEYSNRVAVLANMLKEQYNKPAHSIMGLVYWCRTRRRKKAIDFIKLESRLKNSLRNNEDKLCNGRDDFKDLIERVYNRV
tara:strand:- start:48 stop:812 length:765 start_codon:yes stop_codon:yes gene_type:complete